MSSLGDKRIKYGSFLRPCGMSTVDSGCDRHHTILLNQHGDGWLSKNKNRIEVLVFKSKGE
jgi:hypothetical protein